MLAGFIAIAKTNNCSTSTLSGVLEDADGTLHQCPFDAATYCAVPLLTYVCACVPLVTSSHYKACVSGIYRTNAW